MLVACDVEAGPEARIRLAAAITESELRDRHAERIRWRELCEWDRRARRLIAAERETLGALTLSERPWDAPPEARAAAAADGVRHLGLRWSPAARRLMARVALLRAGGTHLPDLSEPALMADLGWLAPFLSGVRTAEDIAALDPLPALEAMLSWPQREALDRLAPARVNLPTGRAVPVDYEGEAPAVEGRLQEFLGTAAHPAVGPAATPLRVTLLSPAGRPIAVTTDLPGFWAGAYAEVRKEMRGRYPRHDWPEDPLTAAPTARAKPRR